MVASLRHDFRRKARSGDATAFVITRNRDGTFRLVQSRVLTGSGLVVAATRFIAGILAGFMGSMSALRGAKGVTHAAHERQSHVGRDDQPLGALLSQLGPHAACVMFVCMDEHTAGEVAARASERGSDSAQYSRTDFLALLERMGEGYDPVRSTVAEPAAKASKHRPSRRDK